MARDDVWWPPPSKPIPVTGGVMTRRRQGTIGETWWSRRFIEVLESFGLENRLARGRAYARKGQVVRLDVRRGTAHAVVQGSRTRPYRVVIGVDELDEEDWDRVGHAFATKAVFIAKLLAGEMPQNIEDAFSSCSLSLFPESLGDLETMCSCPDTANPCKHIAASLYLLAESFDEDPFRIFEWRGRTKDELLSLLRRADQSRSICTSKGESSVATVDDLDDLDDVAWLQLADDEPLEAQLTEFWTSGSTLSEVRPVVVASPYPDVLLRQLDPFPEQLGEHALVDLLAQAFVQITIAAEARALGIADGPR